MTVHYHGTPITPRETLLRLAGRHFCVPFSDPRDAAVCHDIGQSVMLDNGAFSAWRAGKPTDWPGYYRWCERWLLYRTTWAVIPDVIGGSEDENDALIAAWPHGAQQAAPVWHLNESVERLLRLARAFPRVCLGSSGEYATVGDRRWHARMADAMAALCATSAPPCWLHMLRGMALAGSHYPFASVDSTDIARNHGRPWNDPIRMANRWDAMQCPAIWLGPADYSPPKKEPPTMPDIAINIRRIAELSVEAMQLEKRRDLVLENILRLAKGKEEIVEGAKAEPAERKPRRSKQNVEVIQRPDGGIVTEVKMVDHDAERAPE